MENYLEVAVTAKNNVGVLSGFAWRSPGSLFLIIRRCM